MNRFCGAVFAGVVVFVIAGSGVAQSKSDTSIEVAVVKPHPSAVMHNNFSFKKNRFELEDQPLLKMIAFAYAVNPRQVVDAPRWVSEEHWDMSGTTNLTGDATLAEQQAIVRQLLVERFGLKFHKEKREMPVYALQVLKGQPKLPAAADPAAQAMEWTDGNGSVRTENYRSSSMEFFVTIKQLFMDRPLVDQTGVTGKYDFKLTYSYGDAPNADADVPTMFTAIKEELGLRFEPVNATVDVMVLDAVGQPTAN